jgi:hypothetical protein
VGLGLARSRLKERKLALESIELRLQPLQTTHSFFLALTLKWRHPLVRLQVRSQLASVPSNVWLSIHFRLTGRRQQSPLPLAEAMMGSLSSSVLG